MTKPSERGAAGDETDAVYSLTLPVFIPCSKIYSLSRHCFIKDLISNRSCSVVVKNDDRPLCRVANGDFLSEMSMLVPDIFFLSLSQFMHWHI